MDYIKQIKTACDKRGNQEAAADLLGVSAPFLSDVLNKKRRVSKQLAYALETKLNLDGAGILKAQAAAEFEEFSKQNTDQ